MLRRGARQVVIQITCCARQNHVNIENDDACREQQGKAESFFSRTHCPGTLLYILSHLCSGVTRGVVAIQTTEHRYRSAKWRNWPK